MVHITKTLLESWRYCFSCYEGYEEEAYADFLKTLRREQTETTEAMLNGLAFEDRVYRIAEPPIERRIENVLIRHELSWNKTETWIDSEKLYEVRYSVVIDYDATPDEE